MKILLPILSAFFAALQLVAHILIAPVTLLCGLGLLFFTFKIAGDVSRARALTQPLPEHLGLGGRRWQSI